MTAQTPSSRRWHSATLVHDCTPNAIDIYDAHGTCDTYHAHDTYDAHGTCDTYDAHDTCDTST